MNDNFYVIGVAGYCAPTKFDWVEAWNLVSSALDRVALRKGKDQKIMVLGGLTDISSIHQIAYYVAKQRGWNVGGIACDKAKNYKWLPMSSDGDVLHISGENWGDESVEFINRCDALIRVGGGKQAHNEIDLARVKGIVIEEAEIK